MLVPGPLHPLVAAPATHVGLPPHLPAPEPRNAREDAVQRVVRFALAVSAAALLTIFGLHREYQLGGINAIDTSANAEHETAVLDARQSVESSRTVSTVITVIVLAIPITIGLSRWLRSATSRFMTRASAHPVDSSVSLQRRSILQRSP